MADTANRQENTVVMSREEQLNMERCAEFMARMIQKYGKKVMAKIEAREYAEKESRVQTHGSDQNE